MGTLASEFLDAREGWASAARTGLFVIGVAWLGLLAATLLGQPAFLALVPMVYLGVGGSRLYRVAKRHREEKKLEATGGWRCVDCRARNDAGDAVCSSCGAWRS